MINEHDTAAIIIQMLKLFAALRAGRVDVSVSVAGAWCMKREHCLVRPVLAIHRNQMQDTWC